MNRKKIFTRVLLLVFTLALYSFYQQENDQKDFNERVKISLRQTANQLLLSNQDSTSLVLPIQKIAENKYQISFEKKLTFLPNILVQLGKNNLKKSEITKNYRVEVIKCSDDEVAYSYEINADEEKTIIPCSGRYLPKNCYQIQIKFLEENSSKNKMLFYFLFSILLIVIFIKTFKAKREKIIANQSKKQLMLGGFTFYPDQNKLVKKAKEIALSKKECELLEIFISNTNQVVKREELTKKVWEDNGVIVGRSLDTYISKLRKKLQGDEKIKLTNVHGVGYKLEVK